jgi:hypothetical protein
MKNVLVIDGAKNCTHDIFEFKEEQFAIVFATGTDVAFIDDVEKNNSPDVVKAAFMGVWDRRIPKAKVQGIHGTLFYELEYKKAYYPTRKDEEARNPDGSCIR